MKKQLSSCSFKKPGGKDMPKGTKVHKCVEKMKARGGSANPYAVCQAATGQSYKTGKPLGKNKPGEGPKDSRLSSHERLLKEYGL